LWWEVLCGIRVYRVQQGRKVYTCYCPKCGHTYTVKGDKA
jgi:hypothetical protein